MLEEKIDQFIKIQKKKAQYSKLVIRTAVEQIKCNRQLQTTVCTESIKYFYHL